MARSAGASIFHDAAWLRLVADRYRYPVAAVCVVDDGSGEIAAGLPLAAVGSRLTGRRLVAVPFADACGPLVAPDAPAGALDELVRAVEAERARRAIALEVREGVAALGTTVDLFMQHVVDLTPGWEAVEKAFHSRVRRNVRKARREGVTVERRTDRDALDAFYALHLQTRRRLGVPTQPKSFIRAFTGIFDAGLGFVGLASHGDRPVAAAVFLRNPRGLLYKYGASDEAALQLRPNNVLFADVIRWACEEGLESLDLGRTDAGQEGLASFKRSWGGLETTLAYTYAGREAPEPGEGRALRLLGEVIKRSPPVAGRVVGEALYRHVG